MTSRRMIATVQSLNLAALTLGFASMPLAAQEDRWSFRLTPYLFLAGLEGEVGVGGISADIDESFGDILDHFDFGMMLTFEARKERWGLRADVLYVNLGEDGDIAAPVLPVDGFDFDSKTLILDPGVTYRLTAPGSASIDIAAGIRYWHMSNGLALTDGGTTLVDTESDQNWVDPIIGLQARAGFDSGWLGVARGDIGGFGVGSDFTWQAFGAVGYSFGQGGRYALLAGYRYLDVDYENEDDGFRYDVGMHGPLVGFSLAW